MNIRPKAIASIAGIFAILGVAQVLVERHVIMPSFAELERADAGVAMRRIQNAFDLTLDRITVLASDWGNWATVYRFMQDRNAAPMEADITDSNVREIGVNLVLVVDLDGKVVFSRTVNLPAGQVLELASLPSLPAQFPWRTNLSSGRSVKGLLPTNLGILMLAAGPILDGNGRGDSRGMMILGRLLTADEIRNIGVQAQANVSLLPAPGLSGPDRLSQGDKLTHVDRTFIDIFGRPIMTLRVDVPREITASGRKAVAYASASLLAAAILMLLLQVVVLNKVVLNPLAVLTRHAVTIGKDSDLTTRLDLQRQDEFGVLAREFDRMVERVAESRTQLVDQSFQAGLAELAKGVLHNIGNAMTPIGVRLASLSTRLSAAPADDAARAALELQQQSVDSARSANLREFLQLACPEVAQAVRSAREDVALMTRQADIVQVALAEQLRGARNERVLEPVRLTELLAQSLEIVPDACLQRLAVDTDDTLRTLGVVRVARTILRLILQNLIINAADAVRDAKMERGVLRVSAEIVHEGRAEQLHLQFRDDGVGIAPHNLDRVFERGFSTKSQETNHGIGLHWCANAIGALGGRIWATSEGPGRGTSMHLLVPLADCDTTTPIAGAA